MSRPIGAQYGKFGNPVGINDNIANSNNNEFSPNFHREPQSTSRPKSANHKRPSSANRGAAAYLVNPVKNLTENQVRIGKIERKIPNIKPSGPDGESDYFRGLSR